MYRPSCCSSTRHGTPVEIAAHFGGAERLRHAVEELEEKLYAA
jgi:hypothetical protein